LTAGATEEKATGYLSTPVGAATFAAEISLCFLKKGRRNLARLLLCSFCCGWREITQIRLEAILVDFALDDEWPGLGEQSLVPSLSKRSLCTERQLRLPAFRGAQRSANHERGREQRQAARRKHDRDVPHPQNLMRRRPHQKKLGAERD
jgi:hypothetical protein